MVSINVSKGQPTGSKKLSNIFVDHKEMLLTLSSRKHLRTKVTPDFHLTYSKNGGNLGSESK